MTKSSSFTSRAQAFRDGTSTPLQLLDEALALIARDEPRINAFIELAADAAREAATRSTARWQAGTPLSPLDGALIGVKDIIETIDMPTGQGSPLWSGFATHRDSASVQALREAGAIILGKTATTEFASVKLFAKTTNPHDSNRTPGGSSSGSAAAVGAGIVPLALGSQVVGSTLRPSSYCGCIGFKPTYGALNRGGSYDYLSQSCVGLLGAALDDVWLCARAIASRVGGDPGHAGLSGPDTLPPAKQPKRLAVLETDGWAYASEGAKSAFAAMLEKLSQQGVEIRNRKNDAAIEGVENRIAGAFDLTWKIMGWEFRWPLGTYEQRGADKISPAMIKMLRDAEAMNQGEYAQALQQRATVRQEFETLMNQYDGAITLGATGAAPASFETTGRPDFNVPASLLGVPAISLPLMNDENMPLGLQIMARAGADADLFATARWVLDGV